MEVEEDGALHLRAGRVHGPCDLRVAGAAAGCRMGSRSLVVAVVVVVNPWIWEQFSAFSAVVVVVLAAVVDVDDVFVVV